MLQFVLIALAVAVGVSIGITFRRPLVSSLGFALLAVCAAATAICAWLAFDGLYLHRTQDTRLAVIVALIGCGFFLASTGLWEVLVEKPKRRKEDAEWAAKSAQFRAAVHKVMTAHIAAVFKELGGRSLTACATGMQRGVDEAMLNGANYNDATVKAVGECAATGAMLANAYLNMALVTGHMEHPVYLEDVRYVMRKTQLLLWAKLGDPDDQFMWDVRYGSMDESGLHVVRATWRKVPDLMRFISEGGQPDRATVLASARH